MKLLRSVPEVQHCRKSPGDSLGLVPTMGALHEGHLSLVRKSMQETRQTLVSIYVNPTQFDNAGDLAGYPGTLSEDLAKLESAGVAAVYLPDYEQLYPDDFAYEVREKELSGELCGAHRPGHFTGVLTVVMKLLNLIRPDRAYFGEKDFQQLELIRGLVNSFFLDVEIVGCPIIRESDGLAMSSRNLNLSPCDRKRAGQFHQLLEMDGDDQAVRAALERAGFDVDYVRTKFGRRFGAVTLGTDESPVRLIDNLPLERGN